MSRCSAVILIVYRACNYELKQILKEGTIKLYRDEMGLLPTEIINKIMARFGLDKEWTEEYVEQTLGVERV